MAAATTWQKVAELLKRPPESPAVVQAFIEAATARLEQWCQTRFIQEAITGERHTQNGATTDVLVLDLAPVVSVQQIVDEQSPALSVPTGDIIIDGPAGILRHRRVWPTPFKYWVVDYTAGHFADIDSVPEDIQHAVAIQAARMLTRNLDGVESVSRGDASTNYAPVDDIGPDVKGLLVKYRRRVPLS